MKRDWYVLHVKPRTEKKVMSYISHWGYFGHLPTYTKITKIQRRKIRRELPCFPGYVFARLSPEERVTMLKTNLIVQTIHVERPRPMIHQLRQIARAARKAPAMKPANMCRIGEYVKIVSGPLYGVEGYVVRYGREASLCLNVEILGAAVEVSVSTEDIMVNPK